MATHSLVTDTEKNTIKKIRNNLKDEELKYLTKHGEMNGLWTKGIDGLDKQLHHRNIPYFDGDSATVLRPPQKQVEKPSPPAPSLPTPNLTRPETINPEIFYNWNITRPDMFLDGATPIKDVKQAMKMADEGKLELAIRPLLEEIRSCAKEDGWIFLPVWGANRLGKSSLVLQLLWYVYGSWPLALEHLVFTLPDMIERMKEARRTKTQIPLLVWDDVGVHAGKRTKSFSTQFKAFSEAFDAFGSVVHGLLTTCIRPDSVIPAMRERYMGEVQVFARGRFKYIRYQWRISYFMPGVPFFSKIYVEEAEFFPLPPDIYDHYRLDRARLLNMKLSEVEDLLYDRSQQEGEIKIGEVEKTALAYLLKKLDKTGKPAVRQPVMKDHLFSFGHDEYQVDGALAHLEARNLAVKRGNYWVITPLGKELIAEQAPDKPDKDEED